MVRSNVLQVEPLTPAIGAVLRGVNLSEAASDELIGDIRQALLKHQVIFFEGQDLTPTQQRDFAARFGELHVHPPLRHRRQPSGDHGHRQPRR